jgi:hypothetical protein
MCWTAKYNTTLNMTIITNEIDGVQSMEPHQVVLTPDPMPRRGTNLTTSEHLLPYCGSVRVRRSRNSTGQIVERRPLNVLQWNAEEVLHKRARLTRKLKKSALTLLVFRIRI